MSAVLIVETGAIVPDANTYATQAALETRLANLGRPVTGGSPEAVLRAMAYIEARLDGYAKGSRVSSEQELVFPRYGIYLDGYEIDPESLPKALINALAEAYSVETTTPNTLGPDMARETVAESKTVGPISKSVTFRTGAAPGVTFTKLESYLRTLLRDRTLTR